MTITQHILHNNYLVLNLKGRFDDRARKPVKESVEKARTETRYDLVLNLTEVPFLDSSAIGFLALTNDRLKKEKRQLRLVCPQGYVKNLLELANFHNLIPIVSTEQEIKGKAVATAK